MKVQFLGPEDETTAFGVTFPRGVTVDVSDLSAAHQAKLAGNGTFEEVKGRAKKAVVADHDVEHEGE